MCRNQAHLKKRVPVTGQPDITVPTHDGQKDRNKCKVVDFRSIPDTVPTMSDVTFTMDNGVPLAQQDVYGNASHLLRHKWDYASAFHKEFMLHIEKHFGRRPKNGGGVTDFVHFFGFPLFRIVAANWARLIHKRGLDLDMLEWRPHDHRDTKGSIHTVEETKSRRGALVRHQKAITATLEMLRHLKQQEKAAHFQAEVARLGKPKLEDLEKIKVKYLDDDYQYNKGLSDGLSGEDADGDTWDALYYDFFELKSGVDALEKRADKLAESMVAMMNVTIQSSNRDILDSSRSILNNNQNILASSQKLQVSSNSILESSKNIQEYNRKLMTVNTEIQRSAQMSDERAGALNWMVAFASVVFGAFTIGDVVYPLDPNPDILIPRGNRRFWGLWGIIAAVFAVLAGAYLFCTGQIAKQKDKEHRENWVKQGILPDDEGKYHG